MFGVGNGTAGAVCEVCSGLAVTYIYVFVYVHVCVCVYVCVCVCIYIYIYYVYIYVCVCICICVYIYIFVEILVICLYCRLWAWLAPCSGVSLVSFGQVDAGWVLVILMTRFLLANDIFD